MQSNELVECFLDLVLATEVNDGAVLERRRGVEEEGGLACLDEDVVGISRRAKGVPGHVEEGWGAWM